MRILGPLVAIFLAADAGFALDLTPIPAFRELEGVKIPVTTFKDGSRIVTWQQPWPISGGGARVSLFPPDPPQAVMTLEIRPRKEGDIPPDIAPPPEVLQKWVKPFIPNDATELVPTVTIRGSYLLDSKPSKEYTFTYLSQARRFGTSVSFVDLSDKERIFVVVTAPALSFAAVHATAISSLFQMEWSD